MTAGSGRRVGYVDDIAVNGPPCATSRRAGRLWISECVPFSWRSPLDLWLHEVFRWPLETALPMSPV